MTAKKLLLVYNGLQSIMPPQAQNSPVQPAPQNSSPVIEKPHRSRKKEAKNIIFTVLLFIFAPLLALLMIIFVFQSYVVDGSSMEPTLQNGNRVFILKLPKTVDSLRGKLYIPGRHEIIVFKKPSDPSTQLIKRVIGLPGDHVIVSDNHITIYNKANPGGFNPDTGTSYGDKLAPTDGNVDITVGNDEVFVCGDNRSPGGSLDSRTGLGLVPVDNIIGRLWLRYFPLSEFKTYGTTATLVSWQQFSTALSLNYK